MTKRNRGFTLIEVMITVVIVAILTAIAVPSYQAQMRKSRRAELQTAMTAAAQALERYYTANNSYANAAFGAGGVFPVNVPSGSANPYYTLTLEITDGGQGYTMTGVQSGSGPQSGDKCKDFRLTSAGAKTVSGDDSDGKCWAK